MQFGFWFFNVRQLVFQCISLFYLIIRFNCLALIDLIAYTFFTLISITVAVMIRLGHDDTCNAVKNSYPEPFSNSVTK